MSDVIPVGYRNYVMRDRVLSFGGAESSPTRRVVSEAKDRGTCIDMTKGHKTGCMIVLDTGHIVLSARVPETIAKAMEGSNDRSRENS